MKSLYKALAFYKPLTLAHRVPSYYPANLEKEKENVSN